MFQVALLAEGVDRNGFVHIEHYAQLFESPSSRRAWIEMVYSYNPDAPDDVALLAEGVDRNPRRVIRSARK